LLLSSVSVAEIAIKHAIGKMSLDVPLEEFVRTGMANGQLIELPLRAAHCVRLANLPLHHRDPFDRLLIATAQADDLTLLSNDSEFAQYGVKLAW